jgi:hypothetical protein
MSPAFVLLKPEKAYDPQVNNLKPKKPDHLFADLPSVCVYIDDILIGTENFHEHQQVLGELFHRVRGTCLRVSVTKVEFFRDAVNYVRLHMYNEGFQPQDNHKNHIIQFSVAQDVQTLRSFLALCNYCGDFIPNLDTIAEPLQKLLRKGFHLECGRII